MGCCARGQAPQRFKKFWLFGMFRDAPPYLAARRKAELIPPYIWRIATPIPNEPKFLENHMPDLIGQPLSHYHILEQLGAPQGCCAKGGIANSGQRMMKRISGWTRSYLFTPHLRWVQVSAWYPLVISTSSSNNSALAQTCRRCLTRAMINQNIRVDVGFDHRTFAETCQVFSGEHHA